MINLSRIPLVREAPVHINENNFNYYLLSRDEADELLLLTDDLVDRANKIMLRVMRIQEFLSEQYTNTHPELYLENETENI
jgi:hypothetical protein